MSTTSIRHNNIRSEIHLKPKGFTFKGSDLLSNISLRGLILDSHGCMYNDETTVKHIENIRCMNSGAVISDGTLDECTRDILGSVKWYYF